MHHSNSLLAALLVTATATLAQTPQGLVGLTRNSGDLQQMPANNCLVSTTCSPAGMPIAVGLPGSACGTAWDPTRHAAWICDGQYLACVDDGCSYLCPPLPLPGMGGATFVTGLEVLESRNELWAIDNNDVLHILSLTCPPVHLSSCAIPFPLPSYTTTGIAVDELRGYVFFVRADPAMPSDLVYYNDLATPCALPRTLTTTGWPGSGLTTGLACDATSRTLHLTDGQYRMTIEYQVGPALLLPGTRTACTTPISTDPLTGLAIRPGGATSNGAACASGGCLACPMNHALSTDPVLGNTNFGLHLGGAPVGSFAWCILGAGACTSPGTAVPALCGPIYTPIVLGTSGPTVATGPGGCGGTSSFPLVLPAAAGLAGVVLSSQCVVLCSTPMGFGTSTSNCLSFELQGI